MGPNPSFKRSANDRPLPQSGGTRYIFAILGLASSRSGAGTVLLQAAEKLAAARGKARMDLNTSKTNKPAQAAYEALGWVRDEEFNAYSKAVDA